MPPKGRKPGRSSKKNKKKGKKNAAAQKPAAEKATEVAAPANPRIAATPKTDDVLGVLAMSVKELKQIITDAGLSHADCVEKSELRARAAEAIEKAPTPGGAAADDGGGEEKKNEEVGGDEASTDATTAANDMAAKASKKIITNAGFSHADCFEKSKLRARASEALVKAVTPGGAGGGAAANGDEGEVRRSADGEDGEYQLRSLLLVELSEADRACSLLTAGMDLEMGKVSHFLPHPLPPAITAKTLVREAIRCLDTVGSAERDARWYRLRGQGLLFGMCDAEEAMPFYTRATELDPSHADAFYLLGQCHVDVQKKMQDLQPSTVQRTSYSGGPELPYCADACDAFCRVVELSPGDFDALRSAGQQFYAKGLDDKEDVAKEALDEAVSMLNRALEIQPRDELVLAELADTYIRMSDQMKRATHFMRRVTMTGAG